MNPHWFVSLDPDPNLHWDFKKSKCGSASYTDIYAFTTYCMNILFFVSCLGKKQLFACDLCSVQTSSPVDLQSHFHGKRHKAIAARQMVKDESIPKIQIRSQQRRNCSLGSQCCWCQILTENWAYGTQCCGTVMICCGSGSCSDSEKLRCRLRFRIQTVFSTIFQQQKIFTYIILR